MFDPTTLHSMAERILAVLEEAAGDIGWAPTSCVTAGTPSLNCDSIFVWPDAITPVKEQSGPRCQVVHRARFQYVVATCVGTSKNQGCKDWESGAPASHDKAWYVQTALVASGIGGDLCDDPCSTIRWGDFILLTNDGGYSWWQGSVQIDLSPEELAS